MNQVPEQQPRVRTIAIIAARSVARLPKMALGWQQNKAADLHPPTAQEATTNIK